MSAKCMLVATRAPACRQTAAASAGGAASTGPLRGDGACFVRGQTVTQQAACGPRWDSASSARDTGAKEVKCISNARWSGTGGVPLPAAEAVAWLGSSFGARGLPKRDVATQRRERCRCNRGALPHNRWACLVSKNRRSCIAFPTAEQNRPPCARRLLRCRTKTMHRCW